MFMYINNICFVASIKYQSDWKSILLGEHRFLPLKHGFPR